MKGFTFIELMVVVIIVAVLTATGLPMFHRAVEKSRASEAMATGHNIIEAQNRYVAAYPNKTPNTKSAIDVTLTGGSWNGEGTTFSTSKFAYNLSANGVNAVRQNGPTYTLSFSRTGDRACWGSEICQDLLGLGFLSGEEVLSNIEQSGYGGITKDLIPDDKQAEAQEAAQSYSHNQALIQNNMVCPEGGDTYCKVTENANGTITKKECTDRSDSSTCVTTILNADHTKTVCNENGNAKPTSSGCKATDKGTYNTATGLYEPPFQVTYDEDGNVIEQKACSSLNKSGNCNGVQYYTQNPDGSFSKKNTNCSYSNSTRIREDGTCSSSNHMQVTDYTYDANGRQVSSRGCYNMTAPQCETYTSGSDSLYDSSGKQIGDRWCAAGSIPTEGKCTAYSSGNDYTRNEKGDITSSRTCTGSIPAEGKCSSYSNGYEYAYTYDANGRKNTETQSCSQYTGETCTKSNLASKETQNYAADGTYTGYTRAYCDGPVLNSDGSCSYGWAVTHYNPDGTEASKTSCGTGGVNMINWNNLTCSH